MTYTEIFNASLRFIGTATIGCRWLLRSLFTTFGTMLQNIGIDLSGLNLAVLDLILNQSIITLTIGAGISIYVVVSVVKFFVGVFK